MLILLASAAALAGWFAPSLARWRAAAQPFHSPAAERRVTAAAVADPSLLTRTGLRPEHLLDVSLASALPQPPPSAAPPLRRRPSRSERLALEVVADAAERSDGRVYAGRAHLASTGGVWRWVVPSASLPLRVVSSVLAVASVFSTRVLASGDPLLLTLLLLLAFGSLLLALVDVDTLLIDVPVLLMLAVPLAAVAVLSGFAVSFTALSVVLAVGLTLDLLGSVVVLVSRVRSGFARLLPVALLAFATLLAAVAAPLLLMVPLLLPLPAWVPAEVAPLLLLAALAASGRVLLRGSDVRPGADGVFEVAPGPASGVGAGDLLLLPLAVGLPALLGGPASGLLALALATLLAAGLGLVRVVSGRSGPMPFGPALLAGWLLTPAVPVLPWEVF